MADAVEQFLNAPDAPAVPAAAPSTTAPTNSLLPQTEGVLGLPMGSLGRPRTLGQALATAGTRQRTEFMRQNTEGAIPLDVETGLSGWSRLMYEIRDSKESEITALQEKYGAHAVRLSTDGIPIVRVMDTETGKPKDILVDEARITARDLAAVAGAIPEIAGAVGGFLLGRKLPGIGKSGGFTGFTRDVAAETAGAAVAGVAEDVAIETIDPSGKVNPQRIMEERAKQAAVDATLGTVGVGAMKFFKVLKNPFGRPKQLQFDALQARDYLKGKYGIDVPLTTGEASGNAYLATQEAFLVRQPTGKQVKAIKETQNERILELQQKMVGATDTDEAIGKEAIQTIQSELEPLKEAERTAKKQASQAAEGAIRLQTAAATSPAEAPPLDELGKIVRGKVTGLRDAAKTEADRLYGVVKSLPGGTGKVLGADDIADEAADMLRRLPTVEKTTQVPTGVVGPSGAPILRNQRGEELLKEFVPPNILARLRNLSELKGKDAAFSLGDLQQMRREVYDDIARSEGVPGLGTHYLSEIGDMLTTAIERETLKVGGGPLKNALKAANKHYKEKVIPFNRSGVTELFRRSDEAGFVFDFDVVNRVMTNPGRFQVLKETLGETSPEFSQVKRAVADDILRRSSLDGKTLNAKALFDNLKHFQDKYSPISKDVFGPRMGTLLKLSEELGVAQTSKIGYDELQTILAAGNRFGMMDKLRTVLDAQRAKDAAFKNKILKAVGSDDLSESTLQPAEFVTRFLDSANDAEVKQVLGAISSNPALLDKIRAKTVESLFAKASRPVRPEHVARVLGGAPAERAGSVELTRLLSDPKIKTILGPLSKDVEELAKLVAAPDWVESEFGKAGMFSIGNAAGTLIRKGPLKYTGAVYKDWIVSKIITSPILRYWASRIPAKDPGAWQVVLTSAPFMQMVVEEFGEGTGADRAVESIKGSVDKWFGERQPAQAPDPASQFLSAP